MPSWSQTARGRLARKILHVAVQVLRAPEDVDEVDVARDVGQLPEHRLAQDGRHVGVVDGHGDDLEPRSGEVLRHVERGLAGLRLRLDAEHRHAVRPRQEGGDACFVVDEMGRHFPHGPQGDYLGHATRID